MHNNMTADKNQTYEGKLASLQRIHAHSAPEARQQLEKWGDELSRLSLEAEWLKHPNTEQLRKTLVDQLNRITSVLVNDEKLSEEDRKAFFKTKNVILMILAALSGDPEAEAEAIYDQIDNESEPER